MRNVTMEVCNSDGLCKLSIHNSRLIYLAVYRDHVQRQVESLVGYEMTGFIGWMLVRITLFYICGFQVQKEKFIKLTIPSTIKILH
jgi:hypothetical protein